jgi:hypothetical protein
MKFVRFLDKKFDNNNNNKEININDIYKIGIDNTIKLSKD